MSFEYWDDFNFDEASQDMIDHMIYQGATMGQAMGISQAATKVELRDRGFSFGNAKFSSLWRSINDDRIGFQHFTNINQDSLAIDALLPQADYFDSRYRYVARFDARFDPSHPPLWVTGAFDASQRLTPKEAMEQFASIFINFYGASGEEIDSIQLQGVLFNENFDLE